MKVMKNFRFEEEILAKIKQIAEEEHRSLTGQIEYVLLEYLKEKETNLAK